MNGRFPKFGGLVEDCEILHSKITKIYTHCLAFQVDLAERRSISGHKLKVSKVEFHTSHLKAQNNGYDLLYLLLYKLTFYDKKISPKNHPQLIDKPYTKT